MNDSEARPRSTEVGRSAEFAKPSTKPLADERSKADFDEKGVHVRLLSAPRGGEAVLKHQVEVSHPQAATLVR